MSKISTDKLKISLLEMRTQYLKILKEVGDLENIESYLYDNNSFTTDEGWIVNVEFEEIQVLTFQLLNLHTEREYTFNVSYNINGEQSQYAKTTYKQLLKILKTISNIIKNFIQINNKTEALVFLAANKDSNKLLTHTDPQKSAIYKTIVIKTLSQLESKWKIKDFEIGNSDFNGFALIKQK